MKDLKHILADIQDYLVPKLDTYEQAIYHYIFRHTYLISKESTIFSTRSAEIGYGSGTKNTPPSDSQRSKKLRSLEAKGAIKIIERSHKGILVSIVLPHEIKNLIITEKTSAIDIEKLDFYRDKRLVTSILEREKYHCFYTGKKISETNCYLDHVVPQSAGSDNSYRNIVASSYDANSLKNNKNVKDFIRELYKDDILSLKEFNELKQKISLLQNGNLIPNINTINRLLSANKN